MANAPALDSKEAEKIEFAGKLADWFCAMLAETPVSVDGDAAEFLVGPSNMNGQAANEKFPGVWGADGYHCTLGTTQLFKLGFAGIAERAATNAAKLTGLEAARLEGIAKCYRAACDYAAAWAAAAADAADGAVGDDRLRLMQIAASCRTLNEGPPTDYRSAVQLLWFALPMRNANLTSPPGRLDVHLSPYYTADLDAGDLTPDVAQEIMDEFLSKMDHIWTGDGLMNMVVGGVDGDGNDVSNDVSIMIMDTSARLKIASPQMNVRVHKNTPQDFLDKATELQLAPTGGCSILNDEVIIPMFVAEGVPIDLARNYCCDGCNELLFDSESLIDFTAVEAAKSLELMLFNGETCPLPEGFVPRATYHYAQEEEPEAHFGSEVGHQSGDFTKMTSFEQVFEAYMDQYLFQLKRTMDSFTEGIARGSTEHQTDLFFAGTFPECLETGKDPMDGGVRRRVISVFSGSIPTAADGLSAVKHVIFEQQACTPAELLDALRDDWEGHEALRKQFQAAPRFGNDDERVDEIAAEIVRRFDKAVHSYEHSLDFNIWPALFCHTFNIISMAVNATPDGRKRGDPVAEHFSPVPGRAISGPTAVIRSQTRAPLHRMAGTAVTHVSLSRTALGTPKQAAELVSTLRDTAMKLGLIIANFPIYDVEQMIDAQTNPDQHADLMVRVWGFSDRFITLDKRLQDHLIARAVKLQAD